MQMFLGMIPFYVPCIFGVFGILFTWSNEEVLKRLTFILFSGITIIIIGLRGNIDVDYWGYLDEYNSNPLVFETAIAKGELLYNLLAALFRSMGFQYAVFVLFTTAVSIGIKSYLLIKNCKSPLTALSIYLCIAFIETEMITVKWAIATSLLMLSIHYLYLNRRLLALFAFLGALGFHSFSLLYLIVVPLLFINRYDFYFFTLIGAILLGTYFPMESIWSAINIFEVDLYTVQKIQSYTSQSANPIGTFSALKVLFLLSISLIAHAYNKRANWLTGESLRNISRPAFLFLAISLMLYEYKVFYYRAGVLADFYLILLAVNSVHLAFRSNQRARIYSAFIAMFILWSLFDINNHYISGNLKYYEFATIF